VIDMDLDELRLRQRVHLAYDALAPAAPQPSPVLQRVHARAEERARRLRRRALVASGTAAVALVSLAGVQILPRTLLLRAQPEYGYVDNAGQMSKSQSAPQAPSEKQAVLPQQTHTAALLPCTQKQLAVIVSTGLVAYASGDVVTVSTSAHNSGSKPCQYVGPAVWVTDGTGQQWRLCPEQQPTPPPTPAASVQQVPQARAEATIIATAGLHPGQSASTACAWHTGYDAVAPGTYTVHAVWNGTAATTTLSVTAATVQPLGPYTP
jgi:hypothetical protein